VNSKIFAIVSALGVFSLALCGQTAAQPTKVGAIHFENAIAKSQQGAKALADLNTKYTPKRTEIEKRQADLTAKREQLNKGANTMSDEAKGKLAAEIDQMTRNLNRDLEDASSDYNQEIEQLFQKFYPMVRTVLDKYIKDHGYAMILDIGSAQTPVVALDDSADLTEEIVALIDKANPLPAGSAAAPAAAPAKTLAAPATKK
jgi:outer membrane protein